MEIARKSYLAVVVCLLAAGAANVRADDLYPPNWRGNPGSSYAQWEFLSSVPLVGGTTGPIAQDAGFLPYGNPTLTITPGTGGGWHAQQPTYEASGGTVPLYDPAGPSGDGWWNLSGQIDVTMQDSPDPNPHKEVWIQVTWEPQEPGNVPTVQELAPVVGQETTIPLETHVLWAGDPGNAWRKVYLSVFHFDINPNPTQETFEIRGGINVDELVVDTICVPEPASLGMLGFGAAMLLIRRRKA
jgi:hypothetical protein